MNDKSHVSLEQHVCLVCGTRFDTGAILLDKRLRANMEHHTATGWGLCPEHQKLSDDGFVALVECDPQRSGSPGANRMKSEQAYRTGHPAHLKREVFSTVFNVPIAGALPSVRRSCGDGAPFFLLRPVPVFLAPAKQCSAIRSSCHVMHFRSAMDRKVSTRTQRTGRGASVPEWERFAAH